MRTSSRPAVERLEDRLTPVTYGNPWPDATHLTVSFAPDGTAARDGSSVLFQTLNSVAPTAQWEREALRAFQTWAVNANINLGLVADGGEPLGADGRPQGDSRFGDIRLAAYPMSPEVLALAMPFDMTAGTYSGDVRLNTSVGLGVGGGGQYDLFTVLLHEAGHALGLGHSADPASAMFEQYLGPRGGLSAGDIAALQALYGARNPDAFEGPAGNDTFATATPLNLLTSSDGSLGIQADADVSSLQDADVYRFQAPLSLGSLSVTVHTAGLSLLTPRLTVYDGWGNVVASALSSGPLGGDVQITVPRLLPLGTYYVKVESGTNDVFGIGSYQLQIRGVPLVGALTGALTGAVQGVTGLLNNALPTNGSILTATLLPPLLSRTDSYLTYAYRASINDRYDVDYYRIQAAQPSAGEPNVMTVMVWGQDSNGLLPSASVYDANGNPVSAQVLVNENGSYTLQVANAVPGATYFVKVQAADPTGPNNVGNYFLGIQFGPQAVHLDAVGSGTLEAATPYGSGGMQLTESQLVHLVLTVNAPNQPQTARVRLTVTDSAGNVVATAVARDGLPASLTTFLTPGVYFLRVDGYTTDGSALLPLTYTLQGLRLSDPIGPETEDPTNSPASSSPPPPSGSTSAAPPPSGTTAQSSPPPQQPPPSSTGTTQNPPPPSSGTSQTQPSGSSSSPPPPSNSQPSSYYWDQQSGVSTESPSSSPTTTT
jgi:hypothetical protein